MTSFAAIGLVFASVAAGTADESIPADNSVRLIIDYGDGVEKHLKQLTWNERATVWTVMQQAVEHPRGVRVKHRGRGDTLLVVTIDDVTNEGGSGRNWIYRVNDQLGDRSVGIRKVPAGSTILWRFERYQ